MRTAPTARHGATIGLALAIALSACSGQVDPGERSSNTRVPGAGVGTNPITGGVAGAAGPIDPGVAMADNAMRAADPKLFDLANMYFPGTRTAGGPKRLFRLTRAQLDSTTQTLLPKSFMASVQTAMPRDPLQTNYEYSDNLSWNPANFAPYMGWVTAITDRVRMAPQDVVNCSAQMNAPACLDQQARAFVARAFRGAGSEAQLMRFSQFLVSSAASVGVPAATADLVDVTLSSPSYVFREEVQTDARGVLLPAQLLQSVTYTLADAPPEALGLASTDAVALVGNDQALQQTIAKVLATPQARAKLLNFFIAWLEVKEPADFIISPNVFPEFTPEVAQAAVDDTRRFLDHQLSVMAPSLKDITQSTKAFVSQALAFIYGADARASQMLVDLNPQERLGIFTQPAVIASHSGPTTTRLVKRGVFFTRKVMCLPLGQPPPGVDTSLPATPGATERQKIEGKTAMQPCIGCHAYINPFGFMQESFDAIGRFRTKDSDGLAVDPSASVEFLDEGPVHTQSSVEALRAFTDSARFKQCFARQMFRYYFGRDEGESDDPTLRQMYFSFASADQQDILGMLRLLAGSNVFAQRTEAP